MMPLLSDPCDACLDTHCGCGVCHNFYVLQSFRPNPSTKKPVANVCLWCLHSTEKCWMKLLSCALNIGMQNYDDETEGTTLDRSRSKGKLITSKSNSKMCNISQLNFALQHCITLWWTDARHHRHHHCLPFCHQSNLFTSCCDIS